MDPSQQQPPQNSYPPQTPAPGPAPSPAQYPPQPPTQPYQSAPQQPTQAYTPPQPHQPANSWYTPAPKPDADKPGDVDSYLRAASGPNPLGQQQGGNSVPGQMIGGQYSVDYLDQLAAPTKQPLEKKFIFAGIGAVIALILAAFLMFSTPKTTSVANEVKLYTTMVATSENTRQSSRYIKSSQLSAVNGNLQTILTNATRDMTTPLENMGQDPDSLQSAAKNGAYANEDLASSLEDARLNGIYDRIYANEMHTQVQYILAYMESIKKNNSRKSMQEFISKNESSFETIQESIETFQDSDEASLY